MKKKNKKKENIGGEERSKTAQRVNTKKGKIVRRIRGYFAATIAHALMRFPSSIQYCSTFLTRDGSFHGFYPSLMGKGGGGQTSGMRDGKVILIVTAGEREEVI